MNDNDLTELAERFCAAPLPSSVCSDPCASMVDYQFPRSGTNLLSLDEAKQVLAFVLADYLAATPSDRAKDKYDFIVLGDSGWRKPIDLGEGEQHALNLEGWAQDASQSAHDDMIAAAQFIRIALQSPSDRARVDGEKPRILTWVTDEHGDDRLDWFAGSVDCDGNELVTIRADELRKLRDEREKFMWQVRDTCVRAEAAEQRALAAEKKTIPDSDMDDIMETIQDAADDWKDQGYTSALAEVRDMAAIGRDVMERIADATKPDCQLAGWHPMDSPAEVVTDLLNMLHEAEARERAAIRQREISDRTAQERRELADHNLRLAHEIEADLRAAEQRVRALVEGLQWYEQQVAACRKITPEGEQARTALDRDGGKRARALLPAADGRSGEG